MRTALLILTAALALQAQKAKLPRTADGHPDLQGIWTNATITPLERPAALAGKATVSDAEATAYEKQTTGQIYNDAKRANPEADRDFAYNALFYDRGTELARVDGQKRTSLVIDPPDGKVPPMTDAGRAAQAERARTQGHFDRPQDRPLGERCLVGFGSTSGPPMLPVAYNNNYQIVQTPSAILILVEMVHDARIVYMDGRKHLPATVRQWLGDSIGRWEGDTLVIDTTNFTDKTNFRGTGANLHVVERFTRVDDSTMLYRATIEDPTVFTRNWTIEYPFLVTPGPIYEYACHEGNYAMTDILGGARKEEAESGRKQ